MHVRNSDPLDILRVKRPNCIGIAASLYLQQKLHITWKCNKNHIMCKRAIKFTVQDPTLKVPVCACIAVCWNCSFGVCRNCWHTDCMLCLFWQVWNVAGAFEFATDDAGLGSVETFACYIATREWNPLEEYDCHHPLKASDKIIPEARASRNQRRVIWKERQKKIQWFDLILLLDCFVVPVNDTYWNTAFLWKSNTKL